MNININGCNITNCGGITIVNGRVVSGGGMFGNSQKFDEEKSLQANDINRITIKCDSADILVTTNDTDTINAHFYGEAITSQKPTLSITKNGREAIVSLSIGGSITGRLTLSVAIPARTFEFLSASSYNGAIAIKDEVSAKEMALNAYNGGIISVVPVAVILPMEEQNLTTVMSL